MYLGLFSITKAAITPGTQPARVKSVTIKIDPHPLSKTAKGGKKIDRSTRPKPMTKYFKLSKFRHFFVELPYNQIKMIIC